MIGSRRGKVSLSVDDPDYFSPANIDTNLMIEQRMHEVTYFISVDPWPCSVTMNYLLCSVSLTQILRFKRLEEVLARQEDSQKKRMVRLTLEIGGSEKTALELGDQNPNKKYGHHHDVL